MKPPASIQEIKTLHEELYIKALKEGPRLVVVQKIGERTLSEPFAGRVSALLRGIEEFSAKVRSFEEYVWLRHAALSWQVAFSSSFNIPKVVPLSPPPSVLLEPSTPGRALSEEELRHWVSTHAEYIWMFRMGQHRRWDSTPEEQAADWHLAEVFLACDILDGNINFAARIAPASYGRLENIWLKDVKELIAYFDWKHRGGGFDEHRAVSDYYAACNHIHSLLTNPGIKASTAEFGEPSDYLDKNYLTQGKLDLDKKARSLIHLKAERIWRITGRTIELENWQCAETYVRLFYENITPSVMVENNEESVLNVLRAFHLSIRPENRFHLINCFEIALAIYFIRPELIRAVWTQAGLPSIS